MQARGRHLCFAILRLIFRAAPSGTHVEFEAIAKENLDMEYHVSEVEQHAPWSTADVDQLQLVVDCDAVLLLTASSTHICSHAMQDLVRSCRMRMTF